MPELLTHDELTALTKKAQAGDIAARNTIVERNLGMVPKVVRRRFSRVRDMDFDEMVAEGNLGLMRAVETFDPEESKFSTYATWWIRDAVQRAITNRGHTIRIPYRTDQVLAVICRAEQNSAYKPGQTVDVPSICRSLGISDRWAGMVAQARATRATHVRGASVEWIPARSQDLGAGLDIDAMLQSLDSRSQFVVTRRLGLDNQGCCEFKEIGRNLGLHHQTIQKIYKMAILQLQETLDVLRSAI